MSASRNSRLRKATALVPLAVLSVAWTASIAGVGGPIAVVASAETPSAVLPDGTSVPSQAIEAPASVTDETGSLGEVSGDAQQILASSSTSGIPSAALAAYQRAETVINSADTTCRIPWQLVAAIGRVESNHGRANGNVLTDQGLATPGIYGLPLDGTAATSLIADTDAGAYDNDTTYDRAVGPMQFIPSTWSVVGVDADGDGARNPQDIDDAALGTAVYLCSGDDDLSTPAGQQSAVFRYNHSQSYVDLVLSVMQAYIAGDFTAIPNSAVAAGQLVAEPAPVTGKGDGSTGKKGATKDKGDNKGGTKSPAPTPVPTPTPTPTPAPSPTAAAAPNGSGNGGNDKGPDKGGVKVPTAGGPTIQVPALPSTSVAPVDQVLTQTQAVLQCTLDGLIDNPLTATDKFDTCVKDYTTAG